MPSKTEIGRETNACVRFAIELFVCLVSVFLFIDGLPAAGFGEMDLSVIDAQTQKPIAVRMRITDSLGRAPRIRNVPRLGNDFTFRDTLTFRLKSGRYHFTINRGPHYKQRAGHLDVARDGFDQKSLVLPRFADLRKEGWFGGDLLVQRKHDELALLLDAEELDLAVTPTWTPQVPLTKFQAKLDRSTQMLGKSFADFSAGIASTDGGRLLAANLRAAIDPASFPADTHGFAVATQKHESAHLLVLDPYAWDLPMLVAYGLVDSVAILNDLQRRDEDIQKHIGRSSNEPRFGVPHGLARYGEQIYFQLLNCGLRIAPSAASGSGECDNPPGYNRVYVACGQDFSTDSWWANLERGRAIISNGPLLRVRVNDQLPGHIFRGTFAHEVRLEVTCNLATRQKVDYLEIVKDGLVAESVRLDKWAANQGRLPIIRFDTSGWMLVRAVASGEKGYRCSMTAPFYVEIETGQRISKQSAQFFLDWVYNRATAIRKKKLPPDEMKRLIAQQRHARDYWQRLVDKANAP